MVILNLSDLKVKKTPKKHLYLSALIIDSSFPYTLKGHRKVQEVQSHIEDVLMASGGRVT